MADYSPVNVLKQEPTKVTGAIMAILNVLVVSNAVPWNEVTLGAVNTALVLVLTLFYTAPLVASKSKLEEIDTLAAESRAQGHDEAMNSNFLKAEDVDAIVTERLAAAKPARRVAGVKKA